MALCTQALEHFDETCSPLLPGVPVQSLADVCPRSRFSKHNQLSESYDLQLAMRAPAGAVCDCYLLCKLQLRSELA